jgi:preprotein translocase subunit SecA
LFFKSIRDVTNFYKSPQFKEFTKNTTILSEETDHDSRETIIKRVGQREKITIMTESFSRGTDFKIFDKSINDIGGLHVIQTFISADLSEYIQIRGRTGRQGSKGSVEVLVNENELEKFEIANKVAEFEESMKDAWKKKDLTEL